MLACTSMLLLYECCMVCTLCVLCCLLDQLMWIKGNDNKESSVLVNEVWPQLKIHFNMMHKQIPKCNAKGNLI